MRAMREARRRRCATRAVAAALLCASCGAGERMDLLVVSFDTTRADHSSVYGYERDTVYKSTIHTSRSLTTATYGLSSTAR